MGAVDVSLDSSDAPDAVYPGPRAGVRDNHAQHHKEGRTCMNRFPATVRATLLLLALDAVMWFAFGVAAATGAIASFADMPAFRWVMAGLAWASAAALAGLAILLGRRIRVAFYLAVILLAIIGVLSITDQIGWVDVASLAVSVIPLVLLLKDRAWYLRQ
jgi:lysylphosphatidylglycerol synthetase-like protein (DUF2156 family)